MAELSVDQCTLSEWASVCRRMRLRDLTGQALALHRTGGADRSACSRACRRLGRTPGYQAPSADKRRGVVAGMAYERMDQRCAQQMSTERAAATSTTPSHKNNGKVNGNWVDPGVWLAAIKVNAVRLAVAGVHAAAAAMRRSGCQRVSARQLTCLASSPEMKSRISALGKNEQNLVDLWAAAVTSTTELADQREKFRTQDQDLHRLRSRLRAAESEIGLLKSTHLGTEENGSETAVCLRDRIAALEKVLEGARAAASVPITNRQIEDNFLLRKELCLNKEE
ncbi:MAG: hypothetical protein M1826_002246 [Phylliscum demangeonii]|nr:MAG: hypothetical protein M1826_002246 [Phylliscum demangeonii]